MTLVGFLVAVVVFCVILWAARSLLAAFGVGDPIATVVYVVVGGVVWIIQHIGLSPVRLW